MPSISVPAPVAKFFAKFPLYSYPAPENFYATPCICPTLWIEPPSTTETQLSGDVECLKWQAYLALRGIKNVDLRWDISAEAGVDGHLPTLHLPAGKLLGAAQIPTWADEIQQSNIDPLEGYKDEASRDESRAWVSLLEGVVHSELVRSLRRPWISIS